MKVLCSALLLLVATHNEVPRLFSCLKPNKVWEEKMSKKQCLSLGGRWLPKDEDSIRRTRA
jgi:hypothetical protein